jgi:hypothetical protein
MTCEEFATAGLDLGSAGMDSAVQKAAREHLRGCSHCAVLHENWLALREDLRVLGAETGDLGAPPCVEMRLRQEIRTRHKTFRSQRAAAILGWGLAAAAAVFFVMEWTNWRLQRGENLAARQPKTVETAAAQANSGGPSHAASVVESDLGEVLVASNDSGDFTLLPYSMPPAPEDATVVRVQMQRAALGALGLTVNEEHAGDLIQVDLLVGDDGLPQAVRLPESSHTQAAN